MPNNQNLQYSSEDQRFNMFLDELKAKYINLMIESSGYLNDIKPILSQNITDLKGFKQLAKYVLSKKLVLCVPNDFWVIRNDKCCQFNDSSYIRNYVEPLLVYMHYNKINYRKMSKLFLFIIPDLIYDRYFTDQAGVYFTTTWDKDNKPIHVIFIKEYMEYFNGLILDEIVIKKLKKASLISLFHELTHFHENIQFKMFNYQLIQYKYQGSEINARFLSKMFYQFYIRLHSKNGNTYNRSLALKLNRYCSKLDDLYSEITNEIMFNETILDGIDVEDLINENNPYVMILEKNIAFQNSVNTIENIQSKFYDIIEEVEK